MSLIAVVLGWLVAGRVLRPLQTMTDSIRLISAQNMHQRLAGGLPGRGKAIDCLRGVLEELLRVPPAAQDP